MAVNTTLKNRWVQALGIALIITVAKILSGLTAGNNAPHISPNNITQPIIHHIPVPAGYIDIMTPNSPGSEFYQEAQAAWKKAGFTPNGLVSTMVKQSDLALYYNGGPSPIDKHYIYVNFTESNNPSEQMNGLRSEVDKKVREATEQGISESNNKFSNYVKINKLKYLGIVKDWGTGFIYGMVVPLETHINGKIVNKTKLLLTATVTQPRGGYFIGYVSLISDEAAFNSSITNLEILAKQIAAANAS
jgi:hypothetical protein